MDTHFWLVWCVDGGEPTVKHRGYADAKREAERLARAHRGSEFAVCASILTVSRRDLIVVAHDTGRIAQEVMDEEIPF